VSENVIRLIEFSYNEWANFVISYGNTAVVGTRKNRVVNSTALSILNYKYFLIFVVMMVIMKLIISRVAD